ncbi:MAG: helix-turn-helix domain-containing protein [Acidobacteriota bacterium]
MELSVREAATLMGRSQRTVRAQLARGELPGVKRNGRWRIQRRHLPLTEAQRQALQAKADDVRATVENALPPREARRAGDRTRSIADLDAFRLGAEVLTSLRAAGPEDLSTELRERTCRTLEGSLLSLAEASLHFDRRAKQEALGRCRSQLAHTVGLLLLDTSGEPAAGWIQSLEEGMAPAVAGFARWIDRLERKKR